MALGPDRARVVFSVPVDAKTWVEREAARKGLTTSAFLCSMVVQMKNRSEAQAAA